MQASTVRGAFAGLFARGATGPSEVPADEIRELLELLATEGGSISQFSEDDGPVEFRVARAAQKQGFVICETQGSYRVNDVFRLTNKGRALKGLPLLKERHGLSRLIFGRYVINDESALTIPGRA